MTLVEVLVALALFAVISTVVLAGLTAAIKLSRDDSARLHAVDLATREIEVARDITTNQGFDALTTNQVTDANPLPSGGVVGAPLVIDNVPFTVTRTAQLVSRNWAGSMCDPLAQPTLAYLRVKADVTWPGLGSRPPVSISTLITDPGSRPNSLGNLGVKIVGADGLPVAGQQVTVNGPTPGTGTTGSDGCAFFPSLVAGSYTATVQTTGFVDRTGQTIGTATSQVQAAQISQQVIQYDNAATINVNLTTSPAAYNLPTGINSIPVTLANTGLSAGTTSVTGTTSSRTLTKLWPFPGGYQVWAGNCLDNDPGGLRDLPVSSDPGEVSPTVSVPLGAVDVTGTQNSRAVTATHARDTDPGGCPTSTTITLGTTNASGELQTSLPFGTWKITANSKTVQVTVVKGTGVTTAALP